MSRNLNVSQHLGFWLRRHPLIFPVGWTPLYNMIHPRGRPTSSTPGHPLSTTAPLLTLLTEGQKNPWLALATVSQSSAMFSVLPSSVRRIAPQCATLPGFLRAAERSPTESRKGGGPASASQPLGGPANGEELVLRNLNFHWTFKFKSDRKISRWRNILLASPREAIASANSLKGVTHCASLRFFEKLKPFSFRSRERK